MYKTIFLFFMKTSFWFIFPCKLFFQECEDYFFGENCEKRCNSTCKNCNKTSGECENGCYPGWTGRFCQEGIVCFLLKSNNVFGTAHFFYMNILITCFDFMKPEVFIIVGLTGWTSVIKWPPWFPKGLALLNLNNRDSSWFCFNFF